MLSTKSLIVLFIIATSIAVSISADSIYDFEFDYDEYDGADSYLTHRACRGKSFITLPLGTNGGLDESNLSSFLLARRGSNVFMAMDAGTIWNGIKQYISSRNNVFDIQYPEYADSKDQKIAWFIRNHIVGYLLGHSHLDHLEGLIEVSPEDYLAKATLDYQPAITDGILRMVRAQFPNVTAAPVMLKKKVLVGLPQTVNAVKNNLFNNILWPNLPMFGRYDYVTMTSNVSAKLSDVALLNTATANIAGTIFENMTLTPYEVCHNDIISTAYLFTDDVTGEQIVFFSDTGVPSGNYPCNWQERIWAVWRNINISKLRAIYLESSFVNSMPDSGMFGHLRPKDIMALMTDLYNMSIHTAPVPSDLSHVKLIIQHIKPLVNANPSGLPIREQIYDELQQDNNMHVKVVIPKQGVPICF
ncbi:hypothetical protein SAMD00019534_093530 [Acytostelium subglobosum LB1]|uniref:3'5' cyclic nucleotide phosphodiesterase n=1 Tax=Acytostelium subglobosum TaxID=361139 RepID=H6V7K5_ACYSU|nr:hypothetical protein SAMD00019534_093530 [Acytostelium subglobosum LB1]AFA53076.1 3'5' cyclic nucleotide phosphodiesterase [Acytostelium subglobosum]GAM26178.1 hypothetical protein SAMD00019534_093530 [Acytostelium subglobosum LB1]|eukprot:XP_012750732.1 hypothetical protein SAMD00019534_093530 [Acytostelium subglobosum LB1]